MESSRHYVRAFHEYLQRSRMAYVSVDEARALLVPPRVGVRGPQAEATKLKFFDFVVYQPSDQDACKHQLIELKGRRIGTFSSKDVDEHRPPRPSARMECWITQDDLASLQRWEELFGPQFEATVVFVYWCDDEPPAPLFQEVFEFERRWYALRSISLAAYRRHMKVRSPRWRTLDMTQDTFERVSEPFGIGRGGPVATPFNRPILARSLRELALPAAALPSVEDVLAAARPTGHATAAHR